MKNSIRGHFKIPDGHLRFVREDPVLRVALEECYWFEFGWGWRINLPKILLKVGYKVYWALVKGSSICQIYSGAKGQYYIINTVVQMEIFKPIEGLSRVHAKVFLGERIWIVLKCFAEVFRVLASRGASKIRWPERILLGIAAWAKGIEIELLLAQLHKINQIRPPIKTIACCEMGYVGAGLELFQAKHQISIEFHQHGFLNLLHFPAHFTRYFLQFVWDHKWLEYMLGERINVSLKNWGYFSDSPPEKSSRGNQKESTREKIIVALEHSHASAGDKERIFQLLNHLAPYGKSYNVSLVARRHPRDLSSGSEIFRMFERDPYEGRSISESLRFNHPRLLICFASFAVIYSLRSRVLPIFVPTTNSGFINAPIEKIAWVFNDDSWSEFEELIRMSPIEGRKHLARLINNFDWLNSKDNFEKLSPFVWETSVPEF